MSGREDLVSGMGGNTILSLYLCGEVLCLDVLCNYSYNEEVLCNYVYLLLQLWEGIGGRVSSRNFTLGGGGSSPIMWP